MKRLPAERRPVSDQAETKHQSGTKTISLQTSSTNMSAVLSFAHYLSPLKGQLQNLLISWGYTVTVFESTPVIASSPAGHNHPAREKT